MERKIHKSVLGEAYRKSHDFFSRLQRRIDSAHRHYQNALRELERLQAAEDAMADAEPSATIGEQTANPSNGFVPSSTPAAPFDPPPDAESASANEVFSPHPAKDFRK